MAVLRDDATPDSTENWDDDFEFQQDSNGPTRRSTTSTQQNEDWDDSLTRRHTPLSKDRTNTLTHWAEPGPSTPTKRPQVQTENWDDDFQDKTGSPPHNTSPRSRRSRMRQSVENWDDEFEPKVDSPSGKSARWSSSSSDDGEFGFGDREEDRTVTSRSRRAPLFPGDTPPPPVPPIPTFHPEEPAPFPRSPTTSVFSVPVSESVTYSSTAHLPLRPTRSGSSFGALPPSPPIHRERERRRLRKKSRPPRVDDNIYELDDRVELAARPVTPPREHTQPIQVPINADAPIVETTSSTRGSLVSRIGSVGKRLGAARRKRVSTEPSEVALQETPQGSSVPGSPPSTSSRWFFRHGGGGAESPPGPSTPLKHEKSVDKLLGMAPGDPVTPSRRKAKHADLPEDLDVMMQNGHTHHDSGATIVFGTPRRPTSMQIPPSSSDMRKSRPTSSRHASENHQSRRSRSSSKHRSASASVDDLAKTRIEEEGYGSRGFMGGIRRISITTKHKRTKSSAPSMSEPAQEKRSGERTRPRTSTSSASTPAVPVLPALPPDRGDDATPRPSTRTRPSMDQSRPSVEGVLLPPIELQPPSPARISPTTLQSSHSEPIASVRGIDSLLSSDEASPTPLPSPSRPKAPGSPQQTASLGRSALPPKEKEVISGFVPRRNSLGDLKIPARISQAQVGLRRDLGMVREFATSVEQLKQLQSTYTSLVTEVQALLLSTAPPDPTPPPRALSPTLFNLPRPSSRARSNTNPQTSANAMNAASSHRQLASQYNSIQSKYRISWECAELLIELGGGTPAVSGSTSPPGNANMGTPRGSRDRAITLAGDEPRPDIGIPSSTSSSTIHSNSMAPPLASPPNPSHWRASTGRSDLSTRQLFLLRGMITSDSSMYMDIPEEDVNRHWKWGDAMSTRSSSPMKKRRSHFGMRGLRDMLRSLKKSHTEQQLPILQNGRPAHTPPPLSIAQSSTSVSASTDSSLNLPTVKPGKGPRPQSLIQRRRAKTSTGPESMKSLRDREYHPNSPYATTGPTSLSHKSSPRRPSLASIFRLGQKHKTGSSSSGLADNSNNVSAKPSPQSGIRELQLSAEDVPSCPPSSSGHGSSNTTAEDAEDGWDQVDSASDLELASRAIFGSGAEGASTVRGKKGKSPYAMLQQARRTPNASQSSIWGGGGESPQKTSSSNNQASLRSPISAHSQAPQARSIKLSDVQEHSDAHPPERQSRQTSASSSRPKSRGSGAPSPSPRRPPSRGKRNAGLTGSVRSAPPQTWLSQGHGHSPELQGGALPPSMSPSEGMNISLAMTPENIRPLLENAKEVHARCNECIAELRDLLAARRLVD
ncbi:unnamed protein product [Somion occarium]|uniref:Uncharacterized protein n=1 Tax=Somion occarium TaxID=3059160 RepID=A0ABP1D792_9APHY